MFTADVYSIWIPLDSDLSLCCRILIYLSEQVFCYQFMGFRTKSFDSLHSSTVEMYMYLISILNGSICITPWHIWICAVCNAVIPKCLWWLKLFTIQVPGIFEWNLWLQLRSLSGLSYTCVRPVISSDKKGHIHAVYNISCLYIHLSLIFSHYYMYIDWFRITCLDLRILSYML